MNAGDGMEKGNPLTLLQTSTATMRAVYRLLKKLEVELP